MILAHLQTSVNQNEKDFTDTDSNSSENGINSFHSVGDEGMIGYFDEISYLNK